VRQDKGQLWENFLMSERKKILGYQNSLANTWFWRTKQQQEVDYVEEVNGTFSGYEFKWSEKKGVLFSKTFTAAYQPTNTVVSRQNFRDFVRTA
jgi:predicted AAA+ superfamily ATPase